MSKVVGPGAIQEETEDIRPSLEGASEYEFITLLNPLTDDFAVRVAQDVPVNMPFEIRSKTGFTQKEGDLARNYGINLKNPDFKARKHITNDMIIKAGQTINLKGDQAQVALKQLVDEIIQREGKTRLLADPHIRREVEDRIIKKRGSIQELLDDSLRSTRSQIDEAINQSNEVKDEQAFPELSRPEQADPEPGTGVTYTPDNTGSDRKSVGRPKKADS